MTCGGLSNPDNGMLQVLGSTAGGMAIYTCDTGHSLVGESERECLCTGQWSGNAATCEGGG